MAFFTWTIWIAGLSPNEEIKFDSIKIAPLGAIFMHSLISEINVQSIYLSILLGCSIFLHTQPATNQFC